MQSQSFHFPDLYTCGKSNYVYENQHVPSQVETNHIKMVVAHIDHC